VGKVSIFVLLRVLCVDIYVRQQLAEGSRCNKVSTYFTVTKKN